MVHSNEAVLEMRGSINDTHELKPGQGPDRRAQWIAPVVRQLRAGAAENAFAGRSDGAFTES